MKRRHTKLHKLTATLCLGLWWNVAASAPPSAPAPQDLPPDAVVQRLLAESPEILAGRGQLAVGEAQRRRLEAGPHEWAVTLEGQRRRTQPPGEDPDSLTKDWAVGIERAWRLPGKAELDERLGAEYVALAEAGADTSRRETARMLLAGWFEWVRGHVQWRQAQDDRQLLEKEMRAVQRRRELGDAAKLEVMQSEAALAQMEARQLMTETEMRAAAERLRQLFPGLALPEQVALSQPQALEGSPEAWEETLLARDPALRAARLESRRSGLEAQRTDKERLADPTLGLRLTHERDSEEHLLGLTLTIPIGGAARQADADRSLAEAGIASQREAQALRQSKADIRAAWYRAQASHSSWQRSDAAARQMEAAAGLQARAYELGEGSLADLLNARRLAFTARQEARMAQIEAVERRYRLLLDSDELWAFDAEPAVAAAP